MDPVISPWLIYCISLGDGINVAALVATVATIIGLVITCIFAGDASENVRKGYGNTEYEQGRLAEHQARRKWLIGVFVALLALQIVTPSSKTIATMLVSSQVTHNRVKGATDIVTKVYKDLLGVIESKKEKK